MLPRMGAMIWTCWRLIHLNTMMRMIIKENVNLGCGSCKIGNYIWTFCDTKICSAPHLMNCLINASACICDWHPPSLTITDELFNLASACIYDWHPQSLTFTEGRYLLLQCYKVLCYTMIFHFEPNRGFLYIDVLCSFHSRLNT